MRIQIIYLLLFLLAGCRRPEINNPEDIIAQDAIAAVYVKSVASFFELLPEELQKYSNVSSALADDSKPLALVLTSIDPPEAYLAFPALEGKEEEIKKQLLASMGLESEYWSGYIFVSLKGALPSSFGNESFIPENIETVIYARSQVKKTLEENESSIKDFKRYKILRFFSEYVNSSTNRILTKFIQNETLDFLKQVEDIDISLSSTSFALNCKMAPDSSYAKEINSLQTLTLPVLPGLVKSDFEFSAAMDFAKLSYPLNGIESALRSYLGNINKLDAIFPMDTVFEKLRKSGAIQGTGSFAFDEAIFGGEFILQAENWKEFRESFIGFSKHTDPVFFTDWLEQENLFKTKLRYNTFLGRTFDKEARIMVNDKHLALYYPELGKSTIKLKESEEKGLLKALLKPKKVIPFNTGIKSIIFKVTAEENLLKLNAEIEK